MKVYLDGGSTVLVSPELLTPQHHRIFNSHDKTSKRSWGMAKDMQNNMCGCLMRVHWFKYRGEMLGWWWWLNLFFLAFVVIVFSEEYHLVCQIKHVSPGPTGSVVQGPTVTSNLIFKILVCRKSKERQCSGHKNCNGVFVVTCGRIQFVSGLIARDFALFSLMFGA